MLTEELLSKRAGKFTASENHKLMAGWDKPEIQQPELFSHLDIFKSFETKPLVSHLKKAGIVASGPQVNEMWQWMKQQEPSKGLVTYAKEKAMEELFSNDPSLNFSTIHTRNGNERELECMELLIEATGLDFINIGDDQVHLNDGCIGCTPDGIVLDELDLISTGAEVKCKSPLEHAKNILINNNKDMLENAFDHYTQVQTQMLVTGADHWYFANFNPYAISDSLKFKYIIVKRDEVFIKAMQKRIEIAKEIKAQFLDEIKQRAVA